jgi:tRNA(His) guanylyltransferase
MSDNSIFNIEKEDDYSDEIVSLEDRMKNYELKYDIIIPINHYFCIKIDGHDFSKFTEDLIKPYDKNFLKAMIFTAYDALCEFNAVSAYTQNDEIILIFNLPDSEKKQCHVCNGLVQKLVSLTASFVSIRFNNYFEIFMRDYIINNPEQDIYKHKILDKNNKRTAYFDAKILSFRQESKNEILNYLIWRSVSDCYHNAIRAHAFNILGKNKIKNLSIIKIIKLMEEKNFSWENDVPSWQKYGIFIKKN